MSTVIKIKFQKLKIEVKCQKSITKNKPTIYALTYQQKISLKFML